MKENKIKQITILSAFIALACILSMLDRTLSKLIIVLLPYVGALAPSLKLGIANIVIIIIIYKYDFKWSLLAVVLKCLIAGLLYSGLINFVKTCNKKRIFYPIYKCCCEYSAYVRPNIGSIAHLSNNRNVDIFSFLIFNSIY